MVWVGKGMLIYPFQYGYERYNCLLWYEKKDIKGLS